jgi:hypothetical protein
MATRTRTRVPPTTATPAYRDILSEPGWSDLKDVPAVVDGVHQSTMKSFAPVAVDER